MPLDTLVYSTDADKGKIVPIVYSKRANAPERGEVFTAIVLPSEKKRLEIKDSQGKYLGFRGEREDYRLNCFENYTGYIKKNYGKPDLEVETGRYYRFEIVAGPYTKDRHNFYYAIPLRRLKEKENKEKNVLDAQTYILIERIGEFLLGIRFNRDKTISRLKKNQRNWDWFYKNFM